MNVRKFIAATARDALHKVKETLGPDAIILSNRGIPGGVEIMAVAALDMAMIVPTPVREAPVRAHDYTVSLSAPARQASVPGPRRRCMLRPGLPRHPARKAHLPWRTPCHLWRRARHR